MRKKNQKPKKIKRVIRRSSRKNEQKADEPSHFILSERTRHWVFGVLMFLVAIIAIFSFFDKAGIAGEILKNILSFLVGKVIFILPLFFILGGLAFLHPKRKRGRQIILAIFLLALGASGAMGGLDLSQKEDFGNFALNYAGDGGRIGNILSWPLLKIFGFWVTQLMFAALIIIGIILLWQFLHYQGKKKEIVAEEELSDLEPSKSPRPSLIRKIFKPKFEVKELDKVQGPPPSAAPFSVSAPFAPSPVSSKKRAEEAKELPLLTLTTRPVEPRSGGKDYCFPPLDLLEGDRGAPTSGDIKVNSAIIKRTFQNFGIPVEVSEVNVGPTVTQYALKPAEGVKLSKITNLSNNLSLALASHPIRVEAPIPGRPLVGIEVPNKSRVGVRLKNLLGHPNFQNSVSSLTLALGRDVSGIPVFADLARMPHLLVAGSTGTGKTIGLNNIIMSLLYQNSPETLRLILVDPKRVEFPVYNGLPHLLVPVILNAQKAVNILKWLIGEMERRFDVFSEAKARDIAAYNKLAAKTPDSHETMPYIVLIIDELADLMAAKGREIEGEIVRLAQMARAVGIHLIVATQRPSVEVITGLIKANITSRITFQVASQIDSRTILDMAGAEKLLGSGDMLFTSAETVKPKRIQGAYVSEKEVKSVTNYIKSKLESSGQQLQEEDELSKRAKEEIDVEKKGFDSLAAEEDPLYEEAKRAITEAGRASASLLQRRLRIGYARAARLIDTLEERGVVGPGEGAKPREVYMNEDSSED